MLRREELVACFEQKLHGSIARNAEHIHYRFTLGGQTVATTKISPPSKYRDFGDDILSRIARELRITIGRLKKSAQCDPKATQQIIQRWESLRGR